MPDYIVFKREDSWKARGRYLNKANVGEAIREAYSGPGFYAAFDIANATVVRIAPNPQASSATFDEAESS